MPQSPYIANSKRRLCINTYDGSGQAVHPSVIDFLNEYNIPQWGGYRYWMAMTPYPHSNDSYENPSLLASHDGERWITPNGIKNPLAWAAGGWEHGFHNDPDLIYNPYDNRIWLYFRHASNRSLRIELIRISDDMAMADSITVMKQSPWSQLENKNRSMCIWQESHNRWHMWGGGGSNEPPYGIYYFYSSDGISWSDPIQCLNEHGLDPFHTLGCYNWHMSCKPNPQRKRVEFLCQVISHNRTYSNFTRFLRMASERLWKDHGYYVMHTQCSMDNLTVFQTPHTKPVLVPSKFGWDNLLVYRCCFQIYKCSDTFRYKIWYSPLSRKGKWGIGLTSGFLNDT